MELYIDLENAGLEKLLLARRGEDLLAMVKLLPVGKPYPTRKAEMAALIMEHLAGEALRDTWEGLDHVQRLAVAESLYDPDRRFRQGQFQAKYGKLPKGFKEVGYRQSSPLRLFLYPLVRYEGMPAVVPVDLAERLRVFVPEPPRVEIRSTVELPARVRQPKRGYLRRRVDVPSDQSGLRQHDSEQVALREVLTLLRLVQANAVTVSTATRRPTAASVRRIAAVLEGDDFFDPDEKHADRRDQAPGPIRALAWPLLLQAGKLAASKGSKLALTKAGQAALAAASADVLKNLWGRWITNPMFDELSRIENIKGQTRGRGKQQLTPVAERRHVVAEALAECPLGEWMSFDDFTRFMRASSHDFEVTTDPWTLYLTEPRYGSFGFSGRHDWSFLQGRYVLCVLFEYAATLGLIDIAFTRPEGAWQDFAQLSNVDSLPFLSRYDGLQYFRVNRLGAYCLDRTSSYTPSRPEVRARLSVYPDGRIQCVEGSLGHDEALLLETYAAREAAGVWRLDRARMVAAIENGRNLEELRNFIAERDDQDLPDRVEGFLRQTERASRALLPRGPAVLFECADAETRTRLAEDRTVGPLCLPAGESHLAVPEKSVNAFRKAVHGMGYGMGGNAGVTAL